MKQDNIENLLQAVSLMYFNITNIAGKLYFPACFKWKYKKTSAIFCNFKANNRKEDICKKR